MQLQSIYKKLISSLFKPFSPIISIQPFTQNLLSLIDFHNFLSPIINLFRPDLPLINRHFLPLDLRYFQIASHNALGIDIFNFLK